jgi:hypothetical protein
MLGAAMQSRNCIFKIDHESALEISGSSFEYLFFSEDQPEIAVIGTPTFSGERDDGYMYVYLVDIMSSSYRGTKVRPPQDGTITVSYAEINRLKKMSKSSINEYDNYGDFMVRAKTKYVESIMKREFGI